MTLKTMMCLGVMAALAVCACDSRSGSGGPDAGSVAPAAEPAPKTPDVAILPKNHDGWRTKAFPAEDGWTAFAYQLDVKAAGKVILKIEDRGQPLASMKADCDPGVIAVGFGFKSATTGASPAERTHTLRIVRERAGHPSISTDHNIPEASAPREESHQFQDIGFAVAEPGALPRPHALDANTDLEIFRFVWGSGFITGYDGPGWTFQQVKGSLEDKPEFVEVKPEDWKLPLWRVVVRYDTK
jgi:hypothetical protein